jgi:hypothetical protein
MPGSSLSMAGPSDQLSASSSQSSSMDRPERSRNGERSGIPHLKVPRMPTHTCLFHQRRHKLDIAQNARHTSNRFVMTTLVTFSRRLIFAPQLEQTVLRLQNALASSPDQIASLPPPLARVRELEQENLQLNREVEELRRQLEARNARLRPDIDHRHHGFTPYDDRSFDRATKRPRAMQMGDEPYLVSGRCY